MNTFICRTVASTISFLIRLFSTMFLVSSIVILIVFKLYLLLEININRNLEKVAMPQPITKYINIHV